MRAAKPGTSQRQRKPVVSQKPRHKTSAKPEFELCVKPPRPALKAKVTSKGQITIPRYLREDLGLQSGDEVEFEYIEEHMLWRIRRVFDRAKFLQALEKFRGQIHPDFAGMTADEIIEEMRGPVDLD